MPERHLHESIVPSPRPGAKTILIVDDELEIRRMLARLLTKAGYRVLEADRGVTALRVVKEQVIDLIVLDAMLPEVHGFDVARRIKNSKRYGSIPIMMVSAVYRGWRYAEDLRQTLGVTTSSRSRSPCRILAAFRRCWGRRTPPCSRLVTRRRLRTLRPRSNAA